MNPKLSKKLRDGSGTLQVPRHDRKGCKKSLKFPRTASDFSFAALLLAMTGDCREARRNENDKKVTFFLYT